MKALIFSMCAVGLGFGALFSDCSENTQEKMIIILLGPPGSGKGTQAKKVADEMSLPHISTGDLFRENLKQGTNLGKRVKEFLDSGRLVPDGIVVDMLEDRVSKPDCQKGYVLDGFPRSIPQAEALDRLLASTGSYKVINLKVADQTIIQRIEGRESCPSCGSVYNKYYSPSKKSAFCEKCGTALVQRSDDKREVVEERLRQYYSQTEPLIGFYEKKGKLVHIDGSQDPQIVFSEIMHVIGTKK